MGPFAAKIWRRVRLGARIIIADARCNETRESIFFQREDDFKIPRRQMARHPLLLIFSS